MAEEERIPSLSEKDGTDTSSQSKDTYVPEEPTPDISISLLDIQMPETPDSTKSQISDGDTSRLESPKPVKPVLGKVQAKKRLMAFANQFKALSKSQVKPNLSQHSTGVSKSKDKSVQDDTSVNKSRKKTEEKILAIEEIRREESKSKMLLAEAMAAASMEDESHNKNISGLFESTRRAKDKSKHERMSDDRKNKSIDRKYSERHRHRDKVEKDSSNQDFKDRNGSIERSTRKASQDREKHKKDKKKKNHKDKRDNSKTNANRDKKEEGKDKKESEKEKQDETRERIEATKNKKENVKVKRNDTLEIQTENKDKRDKDKDRWKEKVLSKSNSWADVRKFGLTLDDVIYLRRRENSEKLVKTKSMQQDYTRYFEQMLMLSNHRLKRQALIAEGLYGPKKYPPESIKLTKRTKGLQLSYCENPRVSLLLGISQLLEAVTPERREKIRDICEASPPRIDMEEGTVQQKRNWYQQINAIEHHKDNTWQMTVQLPKSKWDSEDEEPSVSVMKEEVEKSTNELHVSASQHERGSTTSSVTDEDKIDNIEGDNIEEDNKSIEKTIENLTTNDEASTSSSLQPAGNEKLASEYEQFMKMVCTSTDVAKEYSPNKNLVKSASPSSYHEFNIESNLTEDNTNIEISPKEKFDKEDKLQTLEGSIKSTECEESTQSTDCQIQVNENIQIEHTNKNEDKSEDSKSIPSDWENVRIKVERLSDENTESREVKKKKKQKKIISSNSSSNTTSSDSEKEKKKKKRRRKRKVSNSSSSDSDSTDSSSSSSDSSSSEERRKKRKKKKVGKKRKKVKRIMRLKKKRRRKVSDSNSSDSDEHIKKKKKIKKKTIEAKSINNGDISKIISKSPVASSSDEKLLQSLTPGRKIKEEVAGENRKADQIISAKIIVDNASVSDNECLKQKKERKNSKSDESFMGQWEMDPVMIVQQNDDDISSQGRTEESEKMDGLEKGKQRRKRKHKRDIEQNKDRSSKVNEERIHEGKTRSDEEVEAKRKKKREKDNKNSTEFLANWERESERITQQIQNDAKYLKKLEKQKKQRWGETDFDTLNVPSLTQLEKEVYQKQLLADEWEVDSLEAISDLITSKRKSCQSLSKKVEKEVRYDKKTDTYIAVEKEKENVREMKKRQERLCAIRIWEDEQEEGEREELMLLEQRSKRKTEKTDDWDIEEESHFRKNNEQMEVCKVNDIVIENEWTKTDEEKNIKEETNKLTVKSANKRVRKSRWDMGSQSEEKPEIKDIWEEEYTKWSKKNKSEQEFDKIKKRDSHAADYSESSNKSDLIDFYHRKSQNTESVEGSWTEEVGLVQVKNNASVKHLISVKTNDEQLPSVKEQIDQFKEISESDMKFKEKTVELYSPSSPALSQKSHDVEASNESSSGNSVLREKKKKEMLITTDELSIPMSGIPLQLTKLRDTKHASNEKLENILNKEPKLEDKDSANSFDIKPVDDLFDISIKPCSKVHASGHMDIFAEYGSEKSLRGKQHVTGTSVSSMTHTKDDEMNEAKNALKLIPKQLLIRRSTNEQVKPKRILETPLQDPAQHAAALLTIQKKLLESHALKNDINEYPNEEQADRFEQKCDAANNSGNTDNVLLDTTEFSVISKSLLVRATRESRSPASEKAVSVQLEQSENYDRDSKNDDVKKYKTNRNDTNVPSSVRSPNREHRKRSPVKKENEKRYSHDKDKKERKSDDAEKPDRRDIRGPKTDFVDRRRSSPPGRGRRRRSGSPYVSWERQRSGSGSPGHSWSRSRSKSPKRKDETTLRDRDKKRERYDDERSSRSRTDERKEKYARSPLRFGYNEDNFKKHGVASFKNNRDDWSRRRHDNVDRDHEKDTRSYDPMEILRERTNLESEKYRDNRFRTEELDHTFWQCNESGGILRDGNESMDSYTVGQNLPLEYDDRTYYREGSLERNVASPQLKYRRKSNARKERQWEKDLSDLDHHVHRSRNRTPPRSRYSPMRQASERFRRRSRSRSRSWSPLRSRTRSRSRSGSRSRSTSRSRPRLRSQSKSRSRSPFDVRSKEKSASMSRLRSPEHAFRMSELRSSRSPSPGRDRLKEMGRERKDNDESKKFNTCSERGRRIETIVQSGIIPGPNILDSEMSINNSMDTATNFQYSNEIEGGNEYYYTENNLTYPPCIDESSTSSPKRLSLDDRLELELGIKKQHSKDSTSVTSEYPSNFNPNVIAYSSPPPQQQQIMYRQQPTVVQVGNVLQVVPADFNGVQSVRREVPAVTPPPPVRSGSSQVVRVGNVLQVVPTSLDWSNNSSNAGDGGGGGGGGQSITTDQSSGVLYSSAIPVHSPSAPSAPMSVPVPVPVPLPVPPAATNTHPSVATMSPAAALPLSLPVPVPVPVPIPPATAAFPARNEIQQKIVQPVYNYEAILETRRKEREERKRLRELRRKEKERKRIERVNRRALRLLEKNSTSRQSSEVLLDHRKGAVVDPSVLKALKEGEEQTESPLTNSTKEDEEATTSVKEEDEDAAADEEEDEDDDEVEAEAEDDEEEEEEAEDEDEDDDDDEKPLQIINQQIEIDETITDANKDQVEIEAKKEWPALPPPPLKGILVVPGFRRDAISNGNLDDLSDADDVTIKDNSDKDEETDKNNECDKDADPDTKSAKSNSVKPKKAKRIKKSVQFADGVKPGEGTSPSGGEGDMPSPPPPQGIGFREGFSDLRRDKIYSFRKSRKEKRARPQKAKKKVKVKIIKLKKPRITPLTAMMMDDSDEMDDRSPPPPPPGSPPPPHLWPSYLSVYNTTVRAVEQPQATTATLTPVPVQAPPPTPLPLLIPPPPLNYTIQPCSKS